MKIEKAPDRLTGRSEVMSLASGLTVIAFLACWIVVAGKDLPGAWADRSWERAARPMGGIAAGSLLFGGFALFALGHQRLTLSSEGLENAWVVVRPIRRRFVPLADITSIDTVTTSGDENSSTHLRVRTSKRLMKWTLFSDDPATMRDELRTSLRELRRTNK